MTALGNRAAGLLHPSAYRARKRAAALVARAGTAEDWARGLSDDELRTEARTAGIAPHTLLALCREAARRTVRLRAFDVQLRAALRMNAGDVVQMATGEGKTLAGALAAAMLVLGSRDGVRTVHVMTVNDYLARRDCDWMAPFYAALGISCGWLGAESTRAERRRAYGADVTYGSVSEFGYDVLRDRLCTDAAELLVPPPHAALIDEADSVLVDEALVPLVLAGAVAGQVPSAAIVDVVTGLRDTRHYEIDADRRNISLTEDGAARVEQALGGIDLYSAEQIGTTLTEVNVALHAHVLLQRDVHYLVRDGRVQLINEARGRVAHLQRWPDGLHAAVEAKEGVPLSEPGQVLDTTTVQAVVGRYALVSGMTGTATAAQEQFREFYGRPVTAIPTNAPLIRIEEADRIYDTVEAKNAAIIELVTTIQHTGQPVLIGTQDVAESEQLAVTLRAAGIDAAVLNARNDASEAAIIAEAGTFGVVTVSTQMAGRGIDIKLGGSTEADRDRILELGGLYVIGTGRHRSSRLDDQLRGRAGRQGDPGTAVFFTSVQDELVTLHASADSTAVSTEQDGRLDSAWARRLLDHAQRVAEANMLEIHRNTWRYNVLIERQRAIVDERRTLLLTSDLGLGELEAECADRCATLRTTVDESVLVVAARRIVLHHFDACWAEHLAFLAEVRESVHLRALAREDPLDEFHRAAIPAFAQIVPESLRRAAVTFEAATITADGLHEDGAELQRPSSTWTYMVKDNPFGSEIDRTLGSLRALTRGRRR